MPFSVFCGANHQSLNFLFFCLKSVLWCYNLWNKKPKCNISRPCQKSIPYPLPLQLEGVPVHLPTPKTHYVQDILLTGDTPIFATSSSELQFIKHGVICDSEIEMRKVRWKVFKLHHRISESQERSISLCGRCFQELVLPE